MLSLHLCSIIYFLLGETTYTTFDVFVIYIYKFIYRRSKWGKPNDELPVEGSRKDTVLQCEFVDECKAMDMKQTSNCSGFNVTFRPSAFFRRGTLLIYR